MIVLYSKTRHRKRLRKIYTGSHVLPNYFRTSTWVNIVTPNIIYTRALEWGSPCARPAITCATLLVHPLQDTRVQAQITRCFTWDSYIMQCAQWTRERLTMWVGSAAISAVSPSPFSHCTTTHHTRNVDAYTTMQLILQCLHYSVCLF